MTVSDTHGKSYSGGAHMNQLTLSGFDDELMQEMRRLAEREGVSLNQLALRLLR